MENLEARPLQLGANQPKDRFYRGGSKIAAFRGEPVHSTRVPEDWVGSTTSVRGEDPAGQSRLADGRFLQDAIAADPVWWLGEEHVASFGADSKLLVKLLDAGQRLPVHAHPSDDFALEHLGTPHGKAEAWHILSPGKVFIGLNREMRQEQLLEIVATQDIDALLDLLHAIDVDAGDSVYVPPGVLHAIGEGVFLAEVQEPEDLSILLEWRGFEIDGESDGHLGLGFRLALQAIRSQRMSAAEVESLIVRASTARAGLTTLADEYFRLESFVVAGSNRLLDSGFSILIALEGSLELSGDWGTTHILPGTTWLLPAAVSRRTLGGSGTVLIASPPKP